MSDYRRNIPARLTQLQRRALGHLGELASAAIESSESAKVSDALALGVANALEKVAAEIRTTIALAEAEDGVNG